MMFNFARTCFVASITVAAAGLAFQACDKDKKSDDTPTVSNPKSAAAAKAAAKAIKIPDIGGSNLKNLGAELRSIYHQGREQSARMQKLLEDTPSTPDLSQFDICSFMNSSCTSMASEGPSVEDGQSCTTSCPAGGGTAMSCTSAEQKSTCDGVEYTMRDLVSESTTSCSKIGDTVYNFSIAVNMSGNVQGGEITESTALSCKFNFAMSMDLNNPPANDEEAFDTAQLCNSMVCTLGGEAMSCQDMQAAMKEDSCK